MAHPLPPDPNLLPTAGPGPTTYLQLYQGLQDALGGEYGPLYAPYAVDARSTHQELRDRLLSLSEVVPKAFLVLATDTDNVHRTRTIHRVQCYPSHPVLASPWDGKVLAFVGDLLPGNFIDMVEFPEASFALTGEVTIPTTANTTALLAAHPNQGHLLPMAAGTVDTDQVNCRYFIQVPQAYLPLLLNRRLTPRELWEQVVMTIIADNREQSCAPFLAWARVALMLRPDPADPANYGGSLVLSP